MTDNPVKTKLIKIPLSEPQTNIYVDCLVHGLQTSYIDAVTVPLPTGYSEQDIITALEDLRQAHPVLTARITTENDSPMLCCDAPLMWCGKLNANLAASVLMAPFDFNKELVRFGIVSHGADQTDTLVCAIHHMITDFSSDALLVRELERALAKTLPANADAQPDLGFVKDAAYCQAVRGSDFEATCLRFYAGMLDGCDGSTHLLANTQTFDETGHEFYINSNITLETLAAFARKQETTVGALLAGTFAYTLSVFSGETCPVFSALDAGRARLGLEESLGCFLRTDTLRIACDVKTTREFLQNAAAVFTGAMEHNACPYQQLSTTYGLDNNICFNYAPAGSLGLDHGLAGQGSKTVVWNQVQTTHATNDLDFGIYEYEGHLVVRPKYSVKYTDNYMRSFTRTFITILNGLMSSELLADITLASAKDIAAQDALNATEHTPHYPQLLEAFATTLKRYPENVLITHQHSKTTYAQGAAIAQTIAQALQNIGVQPTNAAAIFVPRSQWYLLGALGVLATGAAYVPIDDTHPDERIAFMLSDADVSAIVVTSDTLARAQELVNHLEHNIPLLNLDELEFASMAGSETPVFSYRKMNDRDTACILYTSGTTGKPKGSRIAYLGIANFCEWFMNASELYPQDSYALYASYGFDVHLEMFAPLLMGASTAIVPQDIRLDVNALIEFFTQACITTTELPVSVARLFKGHKLPDTLRILHTGGEAVGALSLNSKCKILDTYGPTEFTVNATWIPVEQKTNPSSIGRPLPNTKVYILDAQGRRVPSGAVGELFVSGPQIAAGYLNRPSETAAAFTPNTLDGSKSGYEYKYATGDMARYLDDGTIGFLGRRDFQVKIRGNRVECGEVEACLLTHPNVRETTVRAVTIANTTELVAYVVCADASMSSDKFFCTDLQAYVASAKPSYMVPAYVVMMDALPLTANGKVDARALPVPDASQKRAPYEAPANDLERTITHAFEDVLEAAEIGATDDFVRLGGDSLKAIRAAALLEAQNVKAVDILQLKTPRAIAASCETSSNKYTQKDIEMRIAHYTQIGRCPLTSSQLNVYYDQLAGGKNTAYRLVFAIDVGGNYSVSDVNTALEQTCTAHPILSKRVAEIDGRAWLVDGPAPTIEDFTTASSFNAAVNIDMYVGPLAHFAVLASDNTLARTVYCVIHHCIFDARSLEIFEQDFQRALQGKELALDTHYLEAAAIDELNITSGFSKGSLTFFDEMFADVEQASIAPLPTQSRGYVSKYIALSPAGIEAFTKEHGLTEVSFFTATFAYAFSIFAGSQTASFCVTDNGRTGNAYDAAIGMYIKNIPLVIDCSIDETLPYMQHVYHQFYAAQAATVLPIGEIARKHPVAHNVIFQYFSDMQSGLFKNGDDDDLTLPTENWEDSIADLDFYLGKRKDDFALYVLHSESYDEQLVQSFITTFERTAQQMMTCARLSSMTLCTADELARMDKTNATEWPLTFENITEAISYHAAKTPDATAIISGNSSYSYSQLDSAVNAFVGELREQQICAGSRVALSCLPCAQFAIAALATMRLGASYVPIEMQQPQSWISNIIDQAQVSAVITLQPQQGVDDTDLSHVDYDIKVLPAATTCTPADENEACVIFTSGSTGQPKGVQVSSIGIASVCQWCARFMAIEPGVVCGMYQSLSFVSHFEPLFAPLFVGATTDIIPASIRMDMNQLAAYLGTHGVTVLKMGASIGRRFITYADAAGVNRLMVSGEQLGQFSTDTNVDVIDAYGASENSARILATHLADKRYTESIGFPVDNTKVYVLDSYGRRLPAGATGMLYTGGIGIMLGYINEPELTASVLIPNAYFTDTSHDYDKLWRTGDRARILPDGTIGFLGRADNQVQIHGMRVEPFEVEACVRTLDSIAEATVQPFKLDNSTELVAYVVPTSEYKNTHTDENELYSAVTNLVAACKPAYMVPAFVVVLDKLPRNTHGKVDKHALPSPKDSHTSGTYVAPTTPEELLLCNALQDVLHVELLGVEDSLRRLGFNSLQAIKAVAAINDERLEVRTLLTHDTVRSIAAHMAQSTKSPSEATSNNQLTTTAESAQESPLQLIPITDEQKKYFYAHGDDLFDYTQSYSNVYRAVSLGATIEPERIQEICQTLITEHPYLQATISIADDGIFIVKHANLPANFRIVYQEKFDLSALYEPYNFLDGSPLHRIYLIIDAAGNKTIYFDVSHTLIDMNSFKILEDDFVALLRGEQILQEEVTAYDYALEVQNLKNEHTQDMRNYYRKLFSEYIPEQHDWLEEARKRSSKETITRVDEDNNEAFANAANCYRQMKLNYNADTLFMHTFKHRVIGAIWSNVSAADIEQYCSNNNITMNCFLYGILARAFTKQTSTQQMLLHVVYDGRMLARYQRTVGCLASTVPLFIDHKTLELPWPEYFKRVQSLLNVGYAYSYFSHEDILRENRISAPAVSLHYYEDLHEMNDDPALDLKATLNESMDVACIKVFKAQHLLINMNIGHDLSEGLTADVLKQIVDFIDDCLQQQNS